MIFYYALAVFGALLTAIGQVALKKYAGASSPTIWSKLTNRFLILSISSFVGTFAIAIYVMRVLDFTIYYALTSLNFGFITALSAIYLKEKIDRRKATGVVVIIFGLIIFNL